MRKESIYNATRHVGDLTRRQIDPYEDLANAIIERAVMDYRELRNGRIPTISEEDQLNLKRSEEIDKIAKQKREIVNFFHSAWFGVLTKLKPEYLLGRLDSEKRRPWKPTRQHVEVSPERLWQEIKKRNLSYQRLEKLTGVKGDYYFRILTRGKNIVPLKRAQKISKGLRIPLKELIIRRI